MKCEKFAGRLDGRRGGLLEPFAVLGVHGEDHDIQVALLSERLLGGIYAVGQLLDLPPGVDGSAREFTDLFRVGHVVRVHGNGSARAWAMARAVLRPSMAPWTSWPRTSDMSAVR